MNATLDGESDLSPNKESSPRLKDLKSFLPNPEGKQKAQKGSPFILTVFFIPMLPLAHSALTG